MDETRVVFAQSLLGLFQEVVDELKEINSKLDDIKGLGFRNSLSDVYRKLDEVSSKLGSIDNIEEVSSKLEDIKGSGLYNSLSDVNSKIDQVILELRLQRV